MEGYRQKQPDNNGNSTTRVIESYAEQRKDLLYYKVLRSLLIMICRDDDTICDVGSNGIDMLSFLPCRKKMSIDIELPFSNDEVTGIKADFLNYEFEEGRVDIITCYQVLEHIDNDHMGEFARKLLKSSHIAIVSVPYMWPKGACKYHVQDPVDVEKLISWFGVSPIFLYKVDETEHLTRLIAVFMENTDSEIDRDYWRKDSMLTAKHQNGIYKRSMKALSLIRHRITRIPRHSHSGF